MNHFGPDLLAVEDAVSGYRYLLSRGISPGRIAIAGDSAGGGLVVAAMLAIREAGLAQPACGWCRSGRRHSENERKRCGIRPENRISHGQWRL